MDSKKISSKLGNIGKVSMCKRVLKHQTTEFGEIPFYKISTFGGKADSFIAKDLYDEFREKYSFPKKGDILISAAGTVGETVIYDGKPAYFQDSNIVWIDNDETKILNSYLYYFFQTKPWLTTNGSTIKRIYNENLRSIEITYPVSLQAQQKIAAVLTALDAKIELNQRINAELESMAKTLYDYWFVQFEFPAAHAAPSAFGTSPKFDREALYDIQNKNVEFGGGRVGAGYKSAGGGMVWNDELKREIPKDWKVESIENCCEIVDCLHAKKPDYEFDDEKYYLLQLENIRDDGLLDLTNKYFVPKNEYQKWISRIEVTEDDILITNAGRVAATAQVPKGIKTGIGRNITAIRPKSVSPTYLFSFFRSSDMIRQVRWNMDAGAFFSSLNVKGIKKLHIIRPSGDIEEQFENIVKPMRRKREELNVESQTLTELRDWLLPMLMNGQVTPTRPPPNGT
ncbi:MAG: restriction endonuclease subunit S [Chloroflexi bacterium]|nr:restriction endonuclease subunit S [Chloroflexota bacterium]